MKILHLPTSVGGNSWGLAQGEKKLGLESYVLITENNWLEYKSDICLNLENKSKVQNILIRLKTFLNIRNKFDVYHFNFGSSLVDFNKYGILLWDLPFYDGKIFMTYNGCDARQKYPTMRRVKFSACHEENCYGGICNDGKLDRIKKKKIKKASKYVNHFFTLNPDLMHFLPKEKTSFLPYAISGWYGIDYEFKEIKDTINILHAPTNRELKGSKYIITALNNLKNRYGNKINITIVEKVPYKKALELYKKAHIVIDQVLIGWYGALGVEVMKSGKALAVFIRDEDLQFIPNKMAKELKEAVINITPYNIEEVLSTYIENPLLIKRKAEAGYEFARKWHDPEYVASITKSYYERNY